jgi:hypothetical protein
MRIIIAEDAAILRDGLAQLLALRGHDVGTRVLRCRLDQGGYCSVSEHARCRVLITQGDHWADAHHV